jgi:hypothetical protein
MIARMADAFECDQRRHTIPIVIPDMKLKHEQIASGRTTDGLAEHVKDIMLPASLPS